MGPWPDYGRPVEPEPVVIVWVIDPVTKQRHMAAKKRSEVKPTDQRVRFEP